MNRKLKKIVTMGIIAVFFLVAGLWYFLSSDRFSEKEDNDTELTSILNSMEKAEPSVVIPEESTAGVIAPAPELVVYVCGAVNSPGIYTLAPGSRLHEAVALAGGFSAEADPAYHNLARSIQDGERIYILSATETKELSTELKMLGENGANGGPGAEGLININSATAEQLMQLPGIGEAKAAGIIEYRSRIGQFTALEEIMNVSGIGEAMFEKIKDKITVK